MDTPLRDCVGCVSLSIVGLRISLTKEFLNSCKFLWYCLCVINQRLVWACVYCKSYVRLQGRIQDFVKEGSESGVYIGGGANPSIVSLKQGVWGAQLPRGYWVFTFV